MNNDLTVGNPQSVLWKFCLPLFGSVILQQCYNLADSWVAGRFLGELPLAAVGNSYEITLFFIAFAFGCNIGCSVIVSRYFGAKNIAGMKTAVSTSVIASSVICVLLMLSGIGGSGLLLNMLHTPEQIFADSKLYLNIYLWGLPFVFFYNISTGIFSALGDSRTPFRFLAASSLSNIALDIYFVRNLKMGVSGVAWATFLCQGVSCILALISIYLRLRAMPAVEKPVYFSFSVLKQFLRIAVPSILQQSFISVGNILIQGLINSFGTGVIAGYAAGVKLNNLVTTSLVAVANGISNFTSQNLGAQKTDRIKAGLRAGLRIVLCLTVPISLLYFIFPGALVRVFLERPSADALQSGILFLRILSPFYPVIAVKIVSDGVLRGSGMMKQFMTGTFTDLLLRVVMAAVLASTPLGSVGIWLSWPLGWIISAGISVFFFRKAYP